MFFLIPIIFILIVIWALYKIYQNDPSSKVGYVLLLIPIVIVTIIIDVITNGMVSKLLNLNFFKTSFYLLLLAVLVITLSLVIAMISNIKVKSDNLRILKCLDILAIIITGILVFGRYLNVMSQEFVDRIIIILIVLDVLSTLALWFSKDSSDQELVKKEGKEKVKQHKIPFGIIVGFLIIVVLGFFFISRQQYAFNKLTLKEVLGTVPTVSENNYDSYDYYLIYNDKIYVYVVNEGILDDYTHTIYSMNLDGSDKKVLAKGSDLFLTHFHFIYNNELYIHSNNFNKKINLKNGKISYLNFKDTMLNKTYQDGKISMVDYSFFHDDAFFSLKRYDAKNNKVLSENRLDDNIASDPYIFNYETSDIYYLKEITKSNNNPYQKQLALFKNDFIITRFDDNIEESQIQLIACNEDYVYYMIDNIIFKVNAQARKVEKEIIPPTKIINRISSGNNEDNYFLGDNKIYSFSLKTDTFEVALDNVNAGIDEVYTLNNKLYFTQNANIIKRKGVYLGTVIVYDPNSKQIIDRYDDLIRVTFDDNNMYLIKEKENDYIINKVLLA